MHNPVAENRIFGHGKSWALLISHFGTIDICLVCGDSYSTAVTVLLYGSACLFWKTLLFQLFDRMQNWFCCWPMLYFWLCFTWS